MVNTTFSKNQINLSWCSCSKEHVSFSNLSRLITCLFTKQNSFCYTPLKLIFSIVTRVPVCNSIVWMLWFKALQMIWLYSPLLNYICDTFCSHYTAHSSLSILLMTYISLTENKTTENKLTYAMSIMCLLYPQGFIFKENCPKS